MQTAYCRCLGCGAKLNAAGTVKDGVQAVPNEGGFTVCVYCSHLMVFNKDMTVRNLTNAEIIEAAGNKDLLEVMAFAAAFREWKKENEQT